MKRKRKAAGGRDSIGAGVQFVLWPDANGLLHLPQKQAAHLSELPSPHWEPSPRSEIRRASRLLSSGSFSSWLSSKNWTLVGFGEAKRLTFARWLLRVLESCDFGGLEVGAVLNLAGAELGISGDDARRLLAAVTREGASLKVYDGIVSAS